jgi:hypothetical protein
MTFTTEINMKTKNILSYLFLASLLLVLSPQARAEEADDFVRINAIAAAKANIERRTGLNRIPGACENLLEEITGENGSAECQALRADCAAEIEESFLADVDEDIVECGARDEEDSDCGFFLKDCTGLTLEECRALPDDFSDSCQDGETPRSRCFDGIRFDLAFAKATAKLNIRLRVACQAEEVEAGDEDPIGNEEPAADPVLGDEAAQGEQIVAADGAVGGCTLGGTETTGNLWNIIWLSLPMLGLRGRKVRG